MLLLTVLAWLFVFAVYCAECRTVSQCFICFGELRVDLVRSNCKCVVHPELTLCGCRDVKIQGLKVKKTPPRNVRRRNFVVISGVVLAEDNWKGSVKL